MPVVRWVLGVRSGFTGWKAAMSSDSGARQGLLELLHPWTCVTSDVRPYPGKTKQERGLSYRASYVKLIIPYIAWRDRADGSSVMRNPVWYNVVL